MSEKNEHPGRRAEEDEAARREGPRGDVGPGGGGEGDVTFEFRPEPVRQRESEGHGPAEAPQVEPEDK
ncbi:hypothetical protein GCM10009678_43520 [Actinomadura kijaniata]|uniref:Uncharacterized protein n=1 Tax=Actinomadura namibiensis TaxID=182080 RepID=A0A7W3LR74_ACTNM|nr:MULTISPECIES: hypothetical protein [Actinomadura]MBA8952763.1 hypothetical protein [Actinomadura namibiensis]